MSLAEEMQKEQFTYSDYKKLPESERWELIEGEAYDMSPAPGITHQRVSRDISTMICNYLEGKKCEAFVAPFDVFLPKENDSEDQINTILQPDISIVCDEKNLSEKGCTGAPDVILEIISPSSASRDQIIKRNIYEKHGVTEYWIVHPIDRIVWKYILINGFYGKPEIFDYKGKPSFQLFPELEIDLYKVFDVKESDYVEQPSPGYRI